RLAQRDIESARIIMRRLMWHLNDESGGIGWGAPEAMGEIMARHKKLAEEYACILVSYIDQSANFIEYSILQRGVLWGLGRLAYARPELAENADVFLPPFMRSNDATHRGLAAWVSGALSSEITTPLLQDLITDEARIKIFINMNLLERTVGKLAQEAIVRINREHFHGLPNESRDHL
ncbi:MAG: DVU0298 family protein, partial [Desulfobacterales bacterium]